MHKKIWIVKQTCIAVWVAVANYNKLLITIFYSTITAKFYAIQFSCLIIIAKNFQLFLKFLRDQAISETYLCNAYVTKSNKQTCKSIVTEAMCVLLFTFCNTENNSSRTLPGMKQHWLDAIYLLYVILSRDRRVSKPCNASCFENSLWVRRSDSRLGIEFFT